MRRTEIRGNRRTVAFLIFAIVVSLSACSGKSQRAAFWPPPQQSVAPGHDSPHAAVEGYLTGLSHKNEAEICSFVAPPQAQLCKFLVEQSPAYSLTPWKLGSAATKGDEAIVVVMGKWCSGKLCVANDDSGKGLPPRAKGFDRAFQATSDNVPNVSVVRVDGKWYVALA